MECEIERTDDLDHPLLLDSHVEQVIIFRVKPKTSGLLSFIGLSYSLTTPDIENCEIIQVKTKKNIRQFELLLEITGCVMKNGTHLCFLHNLHVKKVLLGFKGRAESNF